MNEIYTVVMSRICPTGETVTVEIGYDNYTMAHDKLMCCASWNNICAKEERTTAFMKNSEGEIIESVQ